MTHQKRLEVRQWSFWNQTLSSKL